MEFVPGLGLLFFGLYFIAWPFGFNALAFYNEESAPTLWEYFVGSLVGGLPLIGPGLLLGIAGVLSIRRRIATLSKGPRLEDF